MPKSAKQPNIPIPARILNGTEPVADHYHEGTWEPYEREQSPVDVDELERRTARIDRIITGEMTPEQIITNPDAKPQPAKFPATRERARTTAEKRTRKIRLLLRTKCTVRPEPNDYAEMLHHAGIRTAKNGGYLEEMKDKKRQRAISRELSELWNSRFN